MAALEFALPFNQDLYSLEAIFRLQGLGGNRIREVYLSGPQEFSGSGREPPNMNIDELLQLVDRIHKHGLRVNLVLNSTCEGSHWYSPEVINKKIDYIGMIHEKNGVESVTIANPIYIKEVRKHFPKLEICASVLSDIDCVQRAVLYTEAGANVITPDANINRDFELLKEIKEATGTELKLMVNEGCLYKCPFRKFHFNFTSHKSRELPEVGNIGAVFLRNCLEVFASDPPQILKSGWIRPEDLSKYSGITSYFKIVGRVMKRGKLLNCVRAYLEESWDGGVLDLLGAGLNNFNSQFGAYLDNKSLGESGFFEKTCSCDRNCSRCDYCETTAKRLIRFNDFNHNIDEIGTQISILEGI